MFILICSFVILALACLLGWVYKRADDAFKSFEGLYTDVAVIESSLHTGNWIKSKKNLPVFGMLTKNSKANSK